MDAEKSELLFHIEKLKSEFKSQEVICKRLALGVSKKQNDALALSSQFSNLEWKITQADFILDHEKEHHEKKVEMMEKSKLLIRSPFMINSFGSGELENNDQVVTDLEVKKSMLVDKMQHLQNFNSESKVSIANSRQVVTILKKKNAAIMLKLQKRLQEAENEEKSLNYRLNELQNEYLGKVRRDSF